jgi:hypothetical protein
MLCPSSVHSIAQTKDRFVKFIIGSNLTQKKNFNAEAQRGRGAKGRNEGVTKGETKRRYLFFPLSLLLFTLRLCTFALKLPPLPLCVKYLLD